MKSATDIAARFGAAVHEAFKRSRGVSSRGGRAERREPDLLGSGAGLCLTTYTQQEEDDDQTQRNTEEPEQNQRHCDLSLCRSSIARAVVRQGHRFARGHPAADHSADEPQQ
jgi:hypothetical protein